MEKYNFFAQSSYAVKRSGCADRHTSSEKCFIVADNLMFCRKRFLANDRNFHKRYIKDIFAPLKKSVWTFFKDGAICIILSFNYCMLIYSQLYDIIILPNKLNIQWMGIIFIPFFRILSLLNLIKCKFRTAMYAYTRFCIWFVWRRLEFAFLCADFSRRTFLLK